MKQSNELRKKAKFPFSLDNLWNEIVKHFSKVNTDVSLPQKIGTINNMSIYLVAGDKIKKEKNMNNEVKGGESVEWIMRRISNQYLFISKKEYE